jgi:hypothetical protein
MSEYLLEKYILTGIRAYCQRKGNHPSPQNKASNPEKA